MAKRLPPVIKPPEYKGKTAAYRRFVMQLVNTRLLLDVGLVGLEERLALTDSVIQKFATFRGVTGPIPKDYSPSFHVARSKDGVEIKMDARLAWVMRKIVTFSREQFSGLRYHQYAMLVVYLWGSFETYLYMLFDELYRLRPELLKSKEQLTFDNVVHHRDRILEHLIERQLEALGHNSFAEHAEYLQRRINYRFTRTRRERLARMYLVRNVIAHNSGLVRPAVRDDLPTGIRTEHDELRISNDFLTRMIGSITSAVISIEKHVEAKFFSPVSAKSR